MMKKVLLAAIVLLISAFALCAAEADVTWVWFENDPNVQYYRYQIDGEDDVLLFYILYRWQRKGSTEDSLKQLEMKQDRSFSSLQEKIEKSTEDLKQKLHPDIKYAELDRWATVPDSIGRIMEVLEDEGYYSRRALAKMSPDTLRIKIQKRLKESHAEEKRANNANFYKTIDIAAEAAKEFPELPAATILAELNLIASPGDNLQRAKKQKLQRSSEDSGKN